MSLFSHKNHIKGKNVEPTQSLHATIGSRKVLEELGKYQYSPDEIANYDIETAINNHPLARKPTMMRSKLAYQMVMKNTKMTNRYLLPGQCVIFNYLEPKFKDELEFYDRTPFVIFFGITRTKDGNIREVGINLHYYPPFARARIMRQIYRVFKSYFDKNFNDPSKKPNRFISWRALKHICRRNLHLAFGIKMYIPVLRADSYVVPTRLLASAFYTEGHFSKATLSQIRKFWRSYR